MATSTIPDFNISSITSWLSGKKTYIALVIGMGAVALNHFGLLPPTYAIANDPANWLNDEFQLLVAAFMRAGIAKAGTANPAKLAGTP